MPEQGPRWADIGVNLGDKQFAEDSEQVLGRAADSGVALMLLIGTSVSESETAVALCRQWADAGPALFATAGVHPHNARFFDTEAARTLAHLLTRPEVAAAGEMGLDFNRDFSPRDDQERAFEAQLALAS